MVSSIWPPPRWSHPYRVQVRAVTDADAPLSGGGGSEENQEMSLMLALVQVSGVRGHLGASLRELAGRGDRNRSHRLGYYAGAVAPRTGIPASSVHMSAQHDAQRRSTRGGLTQPQGVTSACGAPCRDRRSPHDRESNDQAPEKAQPASPRPGTATGKVPGGDTSRSE